MNFRILLATASFLLAFGSVACESGKVSNQKGYRRSAPKPPVEETTVAPVAKEETVAVVEAAPVEVAPTETVATESVAPAPIEAVAVEPVVIAPVVGTPEVVVAGAAVVEAVVPETVAAEPVLPEPVAPVAPEVVVVEPAVVEVVVSETVAAEPTVPEPAAPVVPAEEVVATEAVAEGVATKQTATPAPATPINLYVDLQIPDELEAQTQVIEGRDVTLFVGGRLAQASEAMATTLFAAIADPKRPYQATPPEAVLTPRITKLELTQARWSWKQSDLELAVEWSLRDSTGQLIWTDTFSGRARRSLGGGSSTERNARALLKDLIHFIIERTEEALRTSAKVGTFAEATAHSRERPLR